MNTYIQIANNTHIHACVNILQNSEIGNVYFGSKEKTTALITNAISNSELYVAVTQNRECVGFIYYMSQGMFGSYPYLHIVAVKKECRGHGIGSQLIKFFEDNASKYSSTKYFLTVDDFNPKAKQLYEKLGYLCVGALPDFYKKDICCYLMMKSN